jgi:hypothetical protein
VETFKEPLIVDICVIDTDAGKIGRTFRGDQKTVNTWLQTLEKNLDEAKVFADNIKKGPVKVPGVTAPLTPDMIKKVSFEKKTVHGNISYSFPSYSFILQLICLRNLWY